MPSALVVALFVFSVWMTFDAIRRGAELYWYFIILVLPFGAVIYFIFVKLKDYNLRLLPTRATHPDVAGLRQRAEATPNPENTLALAEALEERAKYSEAAAYYQRVLAESAADPRALHGLARCRLSQSEPAEAVELLERVVSADRSHADYRAALDYAEALWQNRQEEDAVELAGALARHTGRINHRLAFAHYLAGMDRNVEARQVVDQVLADLESAPASDARNARWLKKARAMRARLG
jgi:hypothetical protein